MNYRFLALLGMTICLLSFPQCLQAQMTVTGRVTSGDLSVQGAAVGIPDLRISSRTNAEGRYNLIIPAAQVRGQTVSMVARHSRYGSQSVALVVAGGSVEQDFDLATSEQTPVPDAPTIKRAQASSSRTVDSTAFAVSGSVDVASALAGRIPGLLVTSATGPGSSAPMVLRGARSIAGPVQPLIVLDGVPFDNAGSTTASQQFGLGGFDYGTPLQDLALDDIATITVLDAASATLQYGSRAANGVLLITTKQGAAVRGLQLSATPRFSIQAPTRLPSYQNRYGQGLGGQFEFFDGRGGGINDAVDQSWGPALDGQPLAQASLTEPRRADVTYWLPHPAGVRDYFVSGRTIDANIALSGSRQSGSGRLALNARDVTGLTPNAGARRLGLTLSGEARPASRLTGHANFQVIRASAENRPGTGFDEINPVAGFTRMGRQVDLDALRSPIATATEQINWIYTGKNNPFFQALKNSNDDTRNHVIGGGLLRYDIGNGLSAKLRAGVDDMNENRNVDVVSGWKGTYPTALGRRDFSDGGTERQTLDFAERTIDLSVSSMSLRSFGVDLTGTAGVEKRSNKFVTDIAVADTGAAASRQSGSANITSYYVLGSASRAARLFIDAGARIEQSSTFASTLGFAVFPSVAITYDAAKAHQQLVKRFGLGAARLRGSWWRAGNEVTPRSLLRVYAGGAAPLEPTLGVAADSGALPERTTGLEISTELASPSNRVAFDLTMYRERSHDALVLTPFFVGQTGEISNRGIEAQLRATPFGSMMWGHEARWDVAASVARNANRVDKVAEGFDDIAMSPSLWGTTLLARKGEPLGVLLGTRYLRDSVTRSLVLKNGLPIADATRPYVLGSSQPDWTTSLRSRIQVGATEIGFLFDARMGGSVFSATNLWGSYAGTLSSTLEGRESGFVVAGIDTVTRSANATTVSAEDYFHSLAAIHEAWVYDASYWKLREAQVSYALPLRLVPGFREYVLRASLVGRNLLMSAKAPNIDPETALSGGAFQGFEMGQLPGTRSVGLQFTISP